MIEQRFWPLHRHFETTLKTRPGEASTIPSPIDPSMAVHQTHISRTLRNPGHRSKLAESETPQGVSRILSANSDKSFFFLAPNALAFGVGRRRWCSWSVFVRKVPFVLFPSIYLAPNLICITFLHLPARQRSKATHRVAG
jgi:hypothetical protein